MNNANVFVEQNRNILFLCKIHVSKNCFDQFNFITVSVLDKSKKEQIIFLSQSMIVYRCKFLDRQYFFLGTLCQFIGAFKFKKCNASHPPQC